LLENEVSYISINLRRMNLNTLASSSGNLFLPVFYLKRLRLRTWRKNI